MTLKPYNNFRSDLISGKIQLEPPLFEREGFTGYYPGDLRLGIYQFGPPGRRDTKAPDGVKYVEKLRGVIVREDYL